MGKLSAYNLETSGEIAQSKKTLAAGLIFDFLTKALASISQPEPSLGKTASMGSPAFFCLTAR